MKKLILIAAIAICGTAKAQTKFTVYIGPKRITEAEYIIYNGPVTASAQGLTFTLGPKEFYKIVRYHDANLNKALATMRVIKYNSTADIIVNILKRHN